MLGSVLPPPPLSPLLLDRARLLARSPLSLSCSPSRQRLLQRSSDWLVTGHKGGGGAPEGRVIFPGQLVARFEDDRLGDSLWTYVSGVARPLALSAGDAVEWAVLRQLRWSAGGLVWFVLVWMLGLRDGVDGFPVDWCVEGRSGGECSCSWLVGCVPVQLSVADSGSSRDSTTDASSWSPLG